MRSTKLLIPVVAGLAAIGAYWFLLLAPKREEAAALAMQLEQKNAEVQQAETLLAGYRDAEKAYKVNYATVARLGKAVPADDDVRSLVVQVEDAASESKVDFRSIVVSGDGGSSDVPTTAATGPAPPPGATSVGAAGFSVMPLTLQFRGKYLELSDFFNRLERFVTVSNEQVDVTGRLLRIENFSLAPEGEGYPELGASVSASSYLVPPTQGLTAGATVAAPAPPLRRSTARPAPSPPRPLEPSNERHHRYLAAARAAPALAGGPAARRRPRGGPVRAGQAAGRGPAGDRARQRRARQGLRARQRPDRLARRRRRPRARPQGAGRPQGPLQADQEGAQGRQG